MIVIIDYGIGNTGSIINMARKLGFDAVISKDIEVIACASHIILPGVGSFDNAMIKLEATGLIPGLTELALIKEIPFLGICLGMQMLFANSEEGSLKGLNWIPGRVIKFDAKEGNGLKIPHMGWNRVSGTNRSSLMSPDSNEFRFYFTHSYYVTDVPEEFVIGRACHGVTFVCAVQFKNIVGVQFHPEKSHKFGLELFRNFLNS